MCLTSKLLILASLLAAGLTLGKSYEVTGQLQYRQASFNRGVYRGIETESFQYTATVDGDKWFFHVTTSENPVATFDYCDVSYDGDTLYYIRSLQSWVEDQIAVGKSVGSNTAMGIVGKMPVPAVSVNHEIGPIWLTYASAQYFSGLRPGEMALCPLTRGIGPNSVTKTIDHYKQKVQVTPGDSSPAIPSKVIFLESNMSGVLGNGLTNATFEILSYTNLGTLKLPMRSIVKIFLFYREPGKTNTTLMVGHEYELTTDSVVVPSTRTKFEPRVSGTLHTSDLRFKDDKRQPLGVFFYYHKNSWYSESAARKLPEYKRAIFERYRGTQLMSASAAMRAIIVVLVFVIPPLVFFWTLKRRRLKTAAETS
jgi:hypothetical protein